MKTWKKILFASLAVVLIAGAVAMAETARLGKQYPLSFNPTRVVAKTAAYTLVAADSQVEVTATAANVPITLPSINGVTTGGTKAYKIIKKDSTTFDIVVTPATGETIGWESTRYLIGDEDYMVISASGGKNWSVDYESPYVSEDHESGGTNLGTQAYDDVIIFEGSSADEYETTFSVTDPTADRTVTYPDGSGTVMLSSLATNSVGAANGVYGASNALVFEGATDNTYEVSIVPTDPTQDNTITLPDSDGTVMLSSLATNSADNANAVTGTSNGMLFEGTTADAAETTLTTADPSSDRTITMPDGTGTVMLSSLATNSVGATNGVWGVSNGLAFEGATYDAYETTIAPTDPTADNTLTLPNATGTFATITGLGSAGTYSTETASITLTTADCGKIISASTGTQTLVLPATSSGCKLTIINGAGVNNALTIDPDAADNIYGGCTLAGSVTTIDDTAGDSVTNTSGTAFKGDYMTLIGDGSVGWYIIGCQGIWAED